MTDVITTDVINEADLSAAYDGSYYFIAGTGGDLMDWVNGYHDMFLDLEIGWPIAWYKTTGKAVNEFAGENDNPFPDDLTCLLFPLDGMKIGKLAMLKLTMQDRWFDDVIDNMRVE
jgi:hypothetical protein